MLKLTLRRARDDDSGAGLRDRVAFALGIRRIEPGPDPAPPANYRPHVPRQHTGHRRPGRLEQLAGHIRVRPYITAPTNTLPDIPVTLADTTAEAPRVLPHGPQPAAAPGLAPAAFVPARVPHYDDIVPFASGKRRAPTDRLVLERWLLMPPAAPARHAMPGGSK